MPPHNQLSPEEMRELVRETVRETINETFLRLGVKIDDPIEVQKDFQHLRDWRNTTESVKSKALLAAVGLLVSGLLGALWLGLKGSIGK
jgi:hypothetical protein